MLLALLFAQLLAESGHEGPPHAARRAGWAGRHSRPSRGRLPHRDTLAGRRPRG
jgi:hypothetical protein